MYCDLTWDDNQQLWFCNRCGKKYRVPKDSEVFAECQSRTAVQKVVGYAKAVYDHVSSGMESRTDEQVEQLLQICESCDSYDIESKHCRLCGCRCNRGSVAYFNKLRMSSQHCPDGKW